MDNFKAIYKILKVLENSMDLEEVNQESINYNNFDISKERYNQILIMLYNKGYITGIKVAKTGGMTIVNTRNIKITLDGLEYLEENTAMKKIHKTVKGITDLIP